MELKPCPFCKSKPICRISKKPYGEVYFEIKCNKCNTSMQSCEIKADNYNPLELIQGVYDMWNAGLK